MKRTVIGSLLVLIVSLPAFAQTQQKMWYRGAFEGWVVVKDNPAPGAYYRPSPNPTVPLNEASYGQPIPCVKCGHYHYAGDDVCPFCHRVCPRGGNNEPANTVYSPRRLPGQYWYEQQPHYRYSTPVRAGDPYVKYRDRWDY